MCNNKVGAKTKLHIVKFTIKNNPSIQEEKVYLYKHNQQQAETIVRNLYRGKGIKIKIVN